MSNNSEILGVVLAGGLSRRMNGPEKSLLTLDGTSLLDRVIKRLSTQIDQIIINANGDSERFASFNLPIIEDTIEGFAGPLAGVLAAMRWVQNNTPQLKQIITVATDTPFYPEHYVEEMASNHKGDVKISFAKSSDRKHPVFGMWDVDLADELEHFLVEENERKVMLFAQRYELNFNHFEVLNSIDPFFNINTPQDLALATNHLEQMKALASHG